MIKLQFGIKSFMDYFYYVFMNFLKLESFGGMDFNFQKYFPFFIDGQKTHESEQLIAEFLG